MPRKIAEETNDGVVFAQPGGSVVEDIAAENGRTIRDLLSYRISYTANAMSRSAMIRFRDEHGVSIGEWRTVALLGAEPGISLNDLAKLANLDKGQVSRVVSSLVERGYIDRVNSELGGRTIALSLTRRGKALYKALISAAQERDDAFLACLTAQEREALDSALVKLNILAKALTRAPGKIATRKKSPAKSA